jgi:NAD-dependent SIR2 family protein deacetylase
MTKYRNVECRRCGYQWYSEKFAEEGELPEQCTRCYKEAVREIPEPPTRIDIWKEEAVRKWNELPGKIKETKHQAVIWKENNKLLISLINTGLIITLLVAVLIYFLFVR